MRVQFLSIHISIIYSSIYQFQPETACRRWGPRCQHEEKICDTLWKQVQANLQCPEGKRMNHSEDAPRHNTDRNQIRQSCPGLAENVVRCMKSIELFVMSFIQVYQNINSICRIGIQHRHDPNPGFGGSFDRRSEILSLSVLLVPLAPPASSACTSSSHPMSPLEVFNMGEMATA